MTEEGQTFDLPVAEERDTAQERDKTEEEVFEEELDGLNTVQRLGVVVDAITSAERATIKNEELGKRGFWDIADPHVPLMVGTQDAAMLQAALGIIATLAPSDSLVHKRALTMSTKFKEDGTTLWNEIPEEKLAEQDKIFEVMARERDEEMKRAFVEAMGLDPDDVQIFDAEEATLASLPEDQLGR